MTTTALRPLTPRQSQVWRYIRDYHAAHRHGCCVRDICREFAWKSTNGAMCHVLPLIRKGWVEWPTPGHGEYRLAYCILPSRESMEVTNEPTT